MRSVCGLGGFTSFSALQASSDNGKISSRPDTMDDFRDFHVVSGSMRRALTIHASCRMETCANPLMSKKALLHETI